MRGITIFKSLIFFYCAPPLFVVVCWVPFFLCVRLFAAFIVIVSSFTIHPNILVLLFPTLPLPHAPKTANKLLCLSSSSVMVFSSRNQSLRLIESPVLVRCQYKLITSFFPQNRIIDSYQLEKDRLVMANGASPVFFLILQLAAPTTFSMVSCTISITISGIRLSGLLKKAHTHSTELRKCFNLSDTLIMTGQQNSTFYVEWKAWISFISHCFFYQQRPVSSFEFESSLETYWEEM